MYEPIEKSKSLIVSKVLYKMGITSNSDGFHYLREAIIMVWNDRTLLSGITKNIYPTIAKRNSTTPMCVERCIRFTIESCLKRHSNSLDMQKVLGCEVKTTCLKLTNSVLISIIADTLRERFDATLSDNEPLR